MNTLEELLEFEESEVELCTETEKDLELTKPLTAIVIMGDRDRALSIIGKRYQYWEAELEAAEARYKAALEAKHSDVKLIQAKLAWYERQILSALPPSPDASYVDDAVSITYRQSTKCDVTDPEAIPLEYTRVKTEPELNKIKEALKAGEQVPGARLSFNYSLQVKPGGVRAKESEKRRKKEAAKRDIDHPLPAPDDRKLLSENADTNAPDVKVNNGNTEILT